MAIKRRAPEKNSKKVKAEKKSKKSDVVVDVADVKKNKKHKHELRIVDKDPNAEDISLAKFSENALLEYGTEVVEQRAIPDYRDGLKPVHRAILWSMYELGLDYTKGFKKAARTVGEVIGKYHPHGDMAAYDAMVTLANTDPKLVDGYGNWGTPVAPAAAQRYTEARLSAFSCMFLLDSVYLEVVPKIWNFDQSSKMPLFLPSKLPVMLLTGSSGIGYGVAADIPPFGLDGVTKITKLALQGEEITPKLCAKYLVPKYPYGGECLSEKKDLVDFFKTGKGTLLFMPEVQGDYDKKVIRITSFAPGFASQNSIEKKLAKFNELPGVSSAIDESDKTGTCYAIYLNRSVSESQFNDLMDSVEKLLTSKESYHVGYTHRKPDGAKFGRISIDELIKKWTKYRIKLELRVIQHLIGEENKKLDRLNLLVFAVDNRKAIIESLDTKDPDAYLIKKLKKPAEYVKQLLDLQVRKLAKIEKTTLLEKIKQVQAVIKGLQQDLKKPSDRIVKNMDLEMDKYLSVVAKAEKNKPQSATKEHGKRKKKAK